MKYGHDATSYATAQEASQGVKTQGRSSLRSRTARIRRKTSPATILVRFDRRSNRPRRPQTQVSTSRSEIRTGSVVWALVRDHRGQRKRRPAIVLTAEISDEKPIALMAITTTYPDPAPSDHVELPWSPQPGKARTGLARRSAAVLTWTDTVSLEDIDTPVGSIPAKVMATISQRMSEMKKR